MRYTLIAALLASLLLPGPLRSAKDEPISMALMQLLANPEKFDRKSVRVWGTWIWCAKNWAASHARKGPSYISTKKTCPWRIPYEGVKKSALPSNNLTTRVGRPWRNYSAGLRWLVTVSSMHGSLGTRPSFLHAAIGV